MAVPLLLVGAVPYSAELERTPWYRQRVAEALQNAVLATVVEDYDICRRIMQHGAGVVDHQQEQEQEQEELARSVRQIGRDLRRIADRLHCSAATNRVKSPPSDADAGYIPSMKACIAGVAVASGLASLLHRFLSE